MSHTESIKRSEERVDAVCRLIRDVQEGDNTKIILDQFFMLSTNEQKCVLMYIIGGNETRNSHNFIELSKIVDYGNYMKNKKIWRNKQSESKVDSK